MSVRASVFLKHYRFSDTLRWWGLWVSFASAGLSYFPLHKSLRPALQQLAGNLFAGSAALFAVEVAALAVVVSMLTPRVLAEVSPKESRDQNVAVKLLVPFYLGSMAWTFSTVVFGVALIISAANYPNTALRLLLGIGVFGFTFSVLGVLTTLRVVIDVLDTVSRYLANHPNE